MGKNGRVSQGPFIEVAVPLPVDETYDYTLPPGVTVQPGARVLVPYSGRRVTGVVVSVRDTPSRPTRRAIRRRFATRSVAA